MNVENAILSFIFDIANVFLLPRQDKSREAYTNVKDEWNIRYSDKNIACVLDVHYQEKKPVVKRPAILNIHGGGLIIGDKKNSTCWCYEIAGESDTVVFNINYGLPSKDIPLFENVDPKANHSDENLFPSQFKTHMDALQFVIDHADEYSIDLNNVFISGDSAGSEQTAMIMACFCSEEYRNALGVTLPNINPKGFIMNCGLYNMNVYKYIPIGRVMWVKFMGDKAPHKNPMWKYHNPIPYLNDKAQNAFVVRGLTDILTIGQSGLLVAKLRKVGVPTKFYIGKNPLDSFHDFLLSPSKEGKKAVAATRDWIAKCSK